MYAYWNADIWTIQWRNKTMYLFKIQLEIGTPKDIYKDNRGFDSVK